MLWLTGVGRKDQLRPQGSDPQGFANIGSKVMTSQKTSNLETYRKLLEQRAATLDARMHEIEADLDTPASADWEDRAIEREDDEMLETMGAHDQVERAQVQAALARLDAGTFGVCQMCGEEILEERLKLLPHTPFCKDCAS